MPAIRYCQGASLSQLKHQFFLFLPLNCSKPQSQILRLSSVGPIDVNILLPFDENEVQMLSDDVGSPTMDVLVAPSSLARVEEVCSQSGLRVEVPILQNFINYIRTVL